MKRIIVATFLNLFIVSNAVAAPNYSFNVYQAQPYVQNQVVQKSENKIIEIVIDYSGSMRPWINSAKTTLQNILPQIPEGTHVGLRVFGQKINVAQENSNNLFVNINQVFAGAVGSLSGRCNATELVVPISQLNSSTMLAGMNSVDIGSATPLTYALERTVYSDFAGKDTHTPKKIILITDGGESCGGYPCLFVHNMMRSRQDIQIDVIMIGSSTALRCLAKATGGKFYHVNAFNSLDSALTNSMQAQPANNGNLAVPVTQPTTLPQKPKYQFLKE